MTPSEQSFQSDDSQAVCDTATNAGCRGAQQFLTPPGLAAALALPLPAFRVTAADFTIGIGSLLRGLGSRNCLGVDIDSKAIAEISSNPEPHRHWHTATADFTLLFDLLAESACNFDLLALNPPSSLRWDNKRFAALANSKAPAVRECYNPGAATIDSTAATLLCALDRLNERGEGYLLCNESAARELLGEPGQDLPAKPGWVEKIHPLRVECTVTDCENTTTTNPLAPLRSHIWLWLSLPEGTFPDTRITPCVLYFARSHQSINPPLHLSETAEPHSLLTPLDRLRIPHRSGPMLYSDYDFDRTTLPKWRACLAEYRLRYGDAKNDEWNIWFKDGVIQCWLSDFQDFSGRIPRADAAALDTLRGQSPSTLVMQKTTRIFLLRAIHSSYWRVQPAAIEAVEKAERDRAEAEMAEVERVRADEEARRAFEDSERLRRSRFTTFVYIMEDTRKRVFKIGRSKTPGKRERTLQSEVPETALRFSIPAEESHEKELHARFAHRRIRGEWFELTEEDLLAAITFLKGNGDCGRAEADAHWLGTLFLRAQ